MATKKQSDMFEKRLLKYLRDIGKEEIADEDDHVSSNLEALARLTWKEALGYTVMRTIVGKDGEPVEVPERIAPDRYAKQILFDHLLGKPKPQTQKQVNDKRPQAPPVQDRVDDALVGHLNTIAEDSNVNGGRGTRGNKTSASGPISERLRLLDLSDDGS